MEPIDYTGCNTKFTTAEKLDYIREHTNDYSALQDTFVALNADMKVFKATRIITSEKDLPVRSMSVVVNMILPAGTIVYIGSDHSYSGNLKCRASRAMVISQYKRFDYSPINNSFPKLGATYPGGRSPYINGQMYWPAAFSTEYQECAGGVHFFTTLYEAYRY